MTRLLPHKPDPPDPGDGPRVVAFDDPAAEDVFDALGTDTTRAVLSAVYDSPATASDLSERLDLSIQNTKYHIDKLQDADLLEVTETWYSEQGNEMKVYGPAYSSFAVVGGDHGTGSNVLDRLLPAGTVLGGVLAGALVVESVLGPGGTLYIDADLTQGPLGLVAVEGGIAPGLVFVLGCVFGVGLVALVRSYTSTESEE